MVAAADTYLPQYPLEHDDDYKVRKTLTPFVNYYKQAIGSLAAKPFKRLPSLDAKSPERVAELFEDIDLEGSGWHIYAQDWLIKAMRHGMAYTLVDFPTLKGEQGQVVTREDEIRSGARPYCVSLTADQVIGVKWENVQGEMRLTEARIQQSVERDKEDFEQEPVEQIRLIRPDLWQLYEKVKGDDNKEQWVVADEGKNTSGLVPLVPLYTSRVATFEAEPPLRVLAEMNADWWRKRSSQDMAGRNANFEVFTISGMNPPPGDQPLGPNLILFLPEAQARAGWASGGGQGIENGRVELERLETNMRQFAGQFEVKDGPAATATGRLIDKDEALSPLQRWTLNLNDAMENVATLFAAWEGFEDTTAITFDIDFARLSDEDLGMLKFARTNQDISRPAFIKELKRRDILTEDYDAEDDAELIEEDDGGLGLNQSVPEPLANAADDE